MSYGGSLYTIAFSFSSSTNVFISFFTSVYRSVFLYGLLLNLKMLNLFTSTMLILIKTGKVLPASTKNSALLKNCLKSCIPTVIVPWRTGASHCDYIFFPALLDSGIFIIIPSYRGYILKKCKIILDAKRK